MRNSLIILVFFVLGIVCGIYSLLPEFMRHDHLTLLVLYVLLFLVGIGIGADKKAWRTIKGANIKIILIPLSVTIGTLLGVGLFSLLVNGIDLRESLAIGCGFGYYSLSSVLIAEISGRTLGVVALLSNIMREIITLLITPLLARHFGKLAPIASGGATSMDTTLPIITRSIGKEYAILSVFSGIVLTIAAPFLITLILKI